MLTTFLFALLVHAEDTPKKHIVGQAGAPATFMLDARTDASFASRRFCMRDTLSSEGWSCSKWFTDDPASATSERYEKMVKALEYMSNAPDGLPLVKTPEKGFNLVVEFNRMRGKLQERVKADLEQIDKERNELKARNARNCSADELRRTTLPISPRLLMERGASVPPTVRLQTTPAAQTAQPANQPSNNPTNQLSN